MSLHFTQRFARSSSIWLWVETPVPYINTQLEPFRGLQGSKVTILCNHPPVLLTAVSPGLWSVPIKDCCFWDLLSREFPQFSHPMAKWWKGQSSCEAWSSALHSFWMVLGVTKNDLLPNCSTLSRLQQATIPMHNFMKFSHDEWPKTIG